MAASSITKNFVITSKKQVEMFANAMEESYQESLQKKQKSDLRITYLRGPEEVREFMEKRKRIAKDKS